MSDGVARWILLTEGMMSDGAPLEEDRVEAEAAETDFDIAVERGTKVTAGLGSEMTRGDGRGVFWTSLMVEIACLYELIRARHVPEKDWRAERMNTTTVWKEKGDVLVEGWLCGGALG